MTIDFPKGVPQECKEWLDEHVGSRHRGRYPGEGKDRNECAWFYERRFRPYDEQIHDEQPTQGEYIPSITVRDPAKATWFILRWSGV